MEIKVLGSGCSRCHKALEVVQKVVSEQGVDGEVRLKGSVPTESDIKKVLGL